MNNSSSGLDTLARPRFSAGCSLPLGLGRTNEQTNERTNGGHISMHGALSLPRIALGTVWTDEHSICHAPLPCSPCFCPCFCKPSPCFCVRQRAVLQPTPSNLGPALVP